MSCISLCRAQAGLSGGDFLCRKQMFYFSPTAMQMLGEYVRRA